MSYLGRYNPMNERETKTKKGVTVSCLGRWCSPHQGIDEADTKLTEFSSEESGSESLSRSSLLSTLPRHRLLVRLGTPRYPRFTHTLVALVTERTSTRGAFRPLVHWLVHIPSHRAFGLA
jgi:hypothetical protein